MAELKRKIEEKDINKIKELLLKIFGDDKYVDICRLGGMMNHSYKITREDGKSYFFRIPGEGTNKLVSRIDEKKSTELSCSLGIDSKLLYFDEEGYKVMNFIRSSQPMNEDTIKRENIIIQAANIFDKLHHCGKNTEVIFNVFEKACLYEKIILNNGVKLYENYYEIKKIVLNLYENFIKNNRQCMVPCHNDCLVDNWVLDENNRLYLVDWEFSGMNDAIWDLSCLSIEANYTEKEDDILLYNYYKRLVTIEEKKHFVIEKILIDYLWTLWGLTRVPYDGDLMQEYSNNRYERLQNNIEKYQKLK